MRYHYQENEPEGSLTADFEDLGTQFIRCWINHNGVLCVVSNDGHPYDMMCRMMQRTTSNLLDANSDAGTIARLPHVTAVRC